MIVFRNVQKRYPNGCDALNYVSLAIPQGSVTFLSGHSGAGKSSLLKLVALSEIATRGQVLVNDVDLSRLRGNRVSRYRRTVGCVYQDHRLLLDRTVEDNVALPLIVAGLPDRESRGRVRAALDKVGLLRHGRKYPEALSSGEQQRVGIARAVVGRPAVILADEPTGNLDPELADEIMNLFFLLQQLDTTVVIATHNHRYLKSGAAGLLVLREGQIIQDSYS